MSDNLFPQAIPAPVVQPLAVHHLAHDLRGPLNAILGFTELLLEGIEGPLNETQQTDLTAIYKSGQTLLHLINTVIDLNKLEANRLTLDPQPVNLVKLIEKIQTNTPADWIAVIPTMMPLVSGETARIEQMLTGCLDFMLKRRRTGLIKLETEADKTLITLRISGSDIALPPERIAELFEAVVYLDATGRSKLGAGGLDLPLARGLAQLHRGQAWAEQSGENGLALCLSLPLYQPDAGN